MRREPYSDAMMALHADWCAKCEENTPGLNPVMPPRRESFEAERARLASQVERSMRIRGDALWRLLAQRLAPVRTARRGGHSCSGGALTLYFATPGDATRALVLLTGTVADLRLVSGRNGLAGVSGTLDADGPAIFGHGPDPVGDFLRAERDASRAAFLGADPASLAIAAE